MCHPDFRNDVADLGEVLTIPVTNAEVVQTAERLIRNLATKSDESAPATTPSRQVPERTGAS
jgi:hypothetical protein